MELRESLGFWRRYVLRTVWRPKKPLEFQKKVPIQKQQQHDPCPVHSGYFRSYVIIFGSVSALQDRLDSVRSVSNGRLEKT